MFEFPTRLDWFTFPDLDIPGDSMSAEKKRRDCSIIVEQLNNLGQTLKTFFAELNSPSKEDKTGGHIINKSDWQDAVPSDYLSLPDFPVGKTTGRVKNTRFNCNWPGGSRSISVSKVWYLTEDQYSELQELIKSINSLFNSLEEKLEINKVELKTEVMVPVYNKKFPPSLRKVLPKDFTIGKVFDLTKVKFAKEKFSDLTPQQKRDLSDTIVVDAHKKVLEGVEWAIALKQTIPEKPVVVTVKTLLVQNSSVLGSVNQIISPRDFAILTDSIEQEGIKQPLMAVRFKKNGEYFQLPHLS